MATPVFKPHPSNNWPKGGRFRGLAIFVVFVDTIIYIATTIGIVEGPTVNYIPAALGLTCYMDSAHYAVLY